LVEHLTLNQQVTGSSPVGCTLTRKIYFPGFLIYMTGKQLLSTPE